MEIRHGVRSLRHVREIGVKDKKVAFVYDDSFAEDDCELFCVSSDLACWGILPAYREEYFSDYIDQKPLRIRIPFTPTYPKEVLLITRVEEVKE